MTAMVVPSRSLLLWLRALEYRSTGTCARCFSTSASAPSGHSKWATIKHDKAKNDSIKNKQRTAVSKEIVEACKRGGPDPKSNSRLAFAVSNAKKAGMSKDTIEGAILRGQGKSATGAALENVTLEALKTPVALIVDCETDNKLRALQELRLILKTGGAVDGQTAYMFERRGRIKFSAAEGVSVDDVLETALEAGAIDVDQEEESIVVDTEPSEIKSAEASIAHKFGLQVSSAETIWHPNEDTMVEAIEEEARVELQALISQLEEYQGVQGVYTNISTIQ